MSLVAPHILSVSANLHGVGILLHLVINLGQKNKRLCLLEAVTNLSKHNKKLQSVRTRDTDLK